MLAVQSLLALPSFAAELAVQALSGQQTPDVAVSKGDLQSSSLLQTLDTDKCCLHVLLQYERLGFSTVKRPAGPVLWFHALSIGEAAAACQVTPVVHQRQPRSALPVTAALPGSDGWARTDLEQHQQQRRFTTKHIKMVSATRSSRSKPCLACVRSHLCHMYATGIAPLPVVVWRLAGADGKQSLCG